MTRESPIRSRAQHDMLSRAATDAAYAKTRGIASGAAQQVLDAHAAAGAPHLPDRAQQRSAAPRSPRNAVTAIKLPPGMM